MGRRPRNPNAVPRLRLRKRPSGTHYYYDHGGNPRREEPLGTDYGLAVLKWAEYENNRQAKDVVAQVVTFRHVSERYRAVVMPKKAPATQECNERELKKLLAFFDAPPCPLEDITPQQVRRYINHRADAPVRANREKALLSHIWNFARDYGFTTLANPCAGIKGNKERPRVMYVTDEAYASLWGASGAPLREAMDLAYLTGQRPSDVLKMSETDIHDGAMDVIQDKTKTRLRIAIKGQLADLLARITERKRAYPIRCLQIIVDERGRPMTEAKLRKRFVEARKASGSDFQFRDLRAKAASDKADSSGDIRQAQKQLGHSSVVMTEAYVRSRRGAKVDPTK